ncbi:transmembrane protein 145-like [Amphiura filiformis]|uniref:transmembrane protein 145-like n=1 Tax=Amphiura filiformis TaxID=82378 RepID=UPI003B227110
MVMIPLSTDNGCTEIIENGIPYISCKGYRTWKDYQWPRWWYITIQNCGSYSKPGIELSYQFNMTNGDAFLTRHFSADEKIILQTNIAYLSLYVGVIIMLFINRSTLKSRRMLHSTFQLFFWSVVAQFIGMVCLVVSQMNFARTGYMSLEWLETTGHVLSTISKLTFILDSILIAKGFTLTRGKISTSGCIKITIVMVLFTIASAVKYLYQHALADDRDYFNENQTPAAYAGIGLNIFGLAWVLYASTISVKHYPGKGRFYCYFGLFFIVWFLSEPLMIWITNSALSSHSRAQIVHCAHLTVILSGHVFWLVLFFPQNYNTLFPYHMKANQVGILQISDVEDAPGKYFDSVIVDGKVENKVVHECETAATAKPVRPKYNNFFADTKKVQPGKPVPMCDLPVSKIFYATGPVPQPQQVAPEQQTAQVAKKTQKVQYAPVAPSTKITQPAACKDFSIFLASSITRPVPRTDTNIVLASGPVPQQLVHEQQLVKKPQIIKKARATQEPELTHESQLVQNYAAVVPSPEITQPTACKDFSIFLASTIKASIQAQSNSGQDSKEDNAKTEGLQQSQQASESSSFTSIELD